MSGTVTNLPTGSFRMSRIVYVKDLQLAGADLIPLGVMAEIALPTVRGLAMAARTALNVDELRAVGPLMHDQLEKPFDYLQGEFFRAWREVPRGEALGLLAREHSSSLSFLAPSELLVPRRWLMEKGTAYHSVIKQRLMHTVDDEFFEMFFEYVVGDSGVLPEPKAMDEPETLERIAS